MKKIEKVFKQLSNLYEFNRNLQTFKITKPKIKNQQVVQPDSKKRGDSTNPSH
jgi:hypothetical protein